MDETFAKLLLFPSKCMDLNNSKQKFETFKKKETKYKNNILESNCTKTLLSKNIFGRSYSRLART